jgi:hypothetical protein
MNASMQSCKFFTELFIMYFAVRIQNTKRWQ